MFLLEIDLAIIIVLGEILLRRLTETSNTPIKHSINNWLDKISESHWDCTLTMSRQVFSLILYICDQICERDFPIA